MGIKITLTIDNGPTPGVTEKVLEVLRQHNVVATFFVVGKNILDVRAKNLVSRICEEGHRLGNHTFTHSILFGSEPDQAKVLAEIDRTQDALGALGAERLFRPFGGGGELDRRLMSRTAYEHLSAGGYTMVLWNSIPRDWEDPQGWPETALRHVSGQEWTVTVVHDLPTGAMDALDRFVHIAKDNGAEFRADYPANLLPLVAGEKRFAIDGLLSNL